MIDVKRARERELPPPGYLRRSALRATATAALAAGLLASTACAHPHLDGDEEDCAAVGTWLDPATATPIALDQLLAGLAQRPVVLLGEAHDNAEHHRWQLYTLAALHGRHPEMVLGFESFPRRVQPVLDQWVSGELDPVAFLEAADWAKVWGFDPTLYLPLFEFARQNRVPMIALNVDRPFVTRVRSEGWASIPADQRFGLSDPASAGLAYRESLAAIYAFEQRHAAGQPQHGDPHRVESDGDPPTGGGATSAGEVDAAATEAAHPAVETDASEGAVAEPARETEAPVAATEAAGSENDAAVAGTKSAGPQAEASVANPDAAELAAEVDIAAVLETEDFARFVEAQLTWDRAMAEALAAARERQPNALVVGIAGRGHLEYGYGVPHQLADLGIPGAAVLLPIERPETCGGVSANLADAVFVIEPSVGIATARPRPLLGVMLAMTDDGVKIQSVMEGSVAEAAGLRAEDIAVEAAGFPIERLSDLVEVVRRQAPGTWLPLTIRRGEEEMDIVAKFPTEFEPSR